MGSFGAARLLLLRLPVVVGAANAFAVTFVMVALGLIAAVLLPNVPQIFRYREFRRAPETTKWLRWRPNFAWAVVTGLAFTLSLFGMWQRMEFLYFQF